MATALSSSPTPVQPAADYNLRLLWPLARYVQDHAGPARLAELAGACALAPEDFDGKNRWVSADVFEALLAKARSWLADDEEFQRACAYRIEEAFGPMRYVLWATSVSAVIAAAASTYHLVSTCGELTAIEVRPTSALLRFRSGASRCSRLSCLMRQAHTAAMPTLWGLPPAHVTETACCALGDEACELRYHWYDRRRWLPVVVGALGFAALGLVLVAFGVARVPMPIAMALAGGLLGHVIEARRAERANDRTRQEVMAALRQLADDESEARRELLELHGRQKEWTRLVEEEMSARTAAISKLVSGVQELQQARASTLLDFSHDLRNPLQAIQMGADYLQSVRGVKSDADARESVGDIRLAVDRMRRMLGELVEVTRAQRDFVRLAPQRLEIAGLADVLPRRLSALVYGRDLRSTVSVTREAPRAVEIDPLAFDRIVDNLLTNAAKYTDRGSIAVELDGAPGFLVIQVSDTGRGIEQAMLDRVLSPEASTVESGRGDRAGVGLSVVVRLLGQLGGRLEVTSRPGSGTTFRVRLPVAPDDARASAPAKDGLRVLPDGASAHDAAASAEPRGR